jgi:mannose-1-phosphate guanylyltransferase
MGFHVLVLAGGSGTRLWPLSRGVMPKHLLPLAPGGKTLLRDTVERVRDLGDAVHVVTAAAQADGCRSALAGIDGPDLIIAEPTARGTGPALALAVSWIAREDPDALIASVHADARVGDPDGYRAAVLAAAGWAGVTGGLATVGLEPPYPSTGMGYMELAARHDPRSWQQPTTSATEALVEQARRLPAYQTAAFLEKPPRELAEQYVAGGGHLWNLGLFAWRAPIFLSELRSAAPDVATVIEAVVDKRASGDEAGATASYEGLAAGAVEPMILERGAPLTAVRADFPWSDLGSWADLHDSRIETGESDAEGNVLEGDARAISSRGCTVLARGGRLVTVVGADSMVVVDTPDAVLVVPADQAQLVKDAVENLRAARREDVL